jgi:hypothetical protein
MSEITDLAKTIKEENAKTRASNEKIASGTRENGQFASKDEIQVAKETLKKQDEQRVTSMKILGISEKRMAKAEDLTNQIQAQEQIMAAQKATLEESGVDADKTAGYQKEQIKLDKLNAKKDDATGAAASEDEAKAGAKDSKMLTYMKNTAGFLGGIAKQGMQKVKSGLGGFSKFLFGALAVAALAFLDHPKFKEMIITLKDVVIPALAYLYDNVIKPLAIYIGGLLTDLFTDLKSYIDGEKGLGAVIFDNIGIIAGIVTALAPGLVFGALKLAVMGIGKALLWASAKAGITALIMKGLTAVKVAFVAIKASALGFMVPLLPVIAIAAAIVLAFYSLKKAFDDFMFELEATGSIWEATKTAIMSFIANFFGFIPNLIKSTLSWIIGKIGSIFGIEAFADVSKAMDEFDFVEGITSLLTSIGDTISGIWDGLLDAIEGILRSPKLKFLGGGFAADALFGTPEEQSAKKKVKEEEQKVFEEKRIALRKQQKLEKETEEAKKVEKLKAEQNALQPKPVTAPALTPMSTLQSQGANIVNAPTSVVNANSSSNTTTSTPVRQPNMVIGMLAAST